MKHAWLIGLGLFMALPAHAEQRTYVIANQPGEYGVDQCLSTGSRCGSLIADAFCQSNDYAKARSFRVADSTDVTNAVPVTAASVHQLIAIECER